MSDDPIKVALAQLTPRQFPTDKFGAFSPSIAFENEWAPVIGDIAALLQAFDTDDREIEDIMSAVQRRYENYLLNVQITPHIASAVSRWLTWRALDAFKKIGRAN